jgi:hypothetical protein
MSMMIIYDDHFSLLTLSMSQSHCRQRKEVGKDAVARVPPMIVME